MRSKDFFINNLVFLWHKMIASENLIVVAEQITKDEGYKDYLRDKLKEETGHAEWLREDLASIGIRVETTPTPPLASALVGTIYYLIYHKSPYALLGYMLATESRRMGESHLQALEAKYGKSLLRTIRYHVAVDVRHEQELRDYIRTLPLNAQRLIEDVKNMTFQYWAHAVQTFAAA